MFRAISKYLAKSPKLQVMRRPLLPSLSQMAPGARRTGPSNLSAVCYVLDMEASMWTLFGRWMLVKLEAASKGSACMAQPSNMTRFTRHWSLQWRAAVPSRRAPIAPIASEVGSREKFPCAAQLAAEGPRRGRNIPEHGVPFLDGGVAPSAVDCCGKRRRLPTPASPLCAKWVKLHATAFRDLGGAA